MTTITRYDLAKVAPVLAAFAGHGVHGKPLIWDGRVVCPCGQPIYQAKAVTR